LIPPIELIAYYYADIYDTDKRGLSGNGNHKTQRVGVKFTLSLDRLQDKFNMNSTQIHHKFNTNSTKVGNNFTMSII
jgi:hypothetical protein